jgi:hypothetical protein
MGIQEWCLGQQESWCTGFGMGLNWLWEMNREKGVKGKATITAYVCDGTGQKEISIIGLAWQAYGTFSELT